VLARGRVQPRLGVRQLPAERQRRDALGRPAVEQRRARALRQRAVLPPHRGGRLWHRVRAPRPARGGCPVRRGRAGHAGRAVAGAADAVRHYVVPAWERTYGLAGALLAAGVAGAVVAAFLRQRRHQAIDGRVVAIAVAVVALFFVYAITPFSALGPEGRPLQVD